MVTNWGCIAQNTKAWFWSCEGSQSGSQFCLYACVVGTAEATRGRLEALELEDCVIVQNRYAVHSSAGL